MRGQREIKDVGDTIKTGAERFPILLTRFDEGGEFLELLATDGSLGIERLQVIAKVAVNVFVVVALGEFAELPAKAFVAGVVLAGSAPAVASPIAEALGVGLERGFADDVNRPALAHRQVMRRVKRLRGDVAESPRVGGENSVLHERNSGLLVAGCRVVSGT